ncbi:RNA polymerase sigma factor (sigma-70 family) [Actinomadura pelletieri DSM 43383]|uniref:RNA polymerase sigma factor (Sigma-70 family) n=1 Tax=Actinomadura pelletieri DSM 43383 TaxID=1120940 RepID=A0A495QUH8_9ACTN|nr:sigma-70 family RNA polymerase sigma factor [Actinomadura pelletieri]RKS77081.1 RNA polymerase sigma factor (sigma-70 family) [Actinomadura pelletieri DSM 43383]
MSGWPNLDRADDERLARSLAAGDPSALIQVMDRYAARLYDYSHALLRDQDQAAGALHDALIAAYAHVSLLREPDRFRGWLYALVRNECMRRLRDPHRSPERREAPEVEDAFLNEAEQAQRRETRQFVHGALSGLRGREREALDLMLRHGLDVVEIGGVLGINAEAATDLTGEARVRLDEALAAASIARNGRDCPSVAALADDGGWPMPPQTVRKLVHHMETCPACIARRDRTLSAPRLLQVLPVAMMPTDLRGRVMATSTDPALAGDLAAIARRAEPFDAWGWPVAVDMVAAAPSSGHGGPRALWPILAAVAAIVVVVASAYYVMSGSPETKTSAHGAPSGPVVSPPDSSLPTESEEPSESPTPMESETPTPTPTSATPTPTRTRRTPTPTPTRTTPRTGTLVVGSPSCGVLGPGDSCSIPVSASGGTVRWSASAGAPLSGRGGGRIPSGESSAATFTLTCNEPGSGSANVVFSPGGVTRSISWQCPENPESGND